MNRKKNVLFFVVLTASFFSPDFWAQDRPMVLVVTSYNNAQWYKKNLDAVFSQEYSNYRVIYVDDASPDGTGDLVEQYIAQRGLEDKVTLIKNEKRMFKMYNFYHAVHECCDDDEIVFDHDGDDWFCRNDALSIINEAYEDSNVWLTYGSYKDFPRGKRGDNSRQIPREWVEKSSYRENIWVTSHQKTFYAWLFKRIPMDAFLYEDEFIRAANDLAFMFPMLEMAGGRFKYIDQVIYTYNTASSINNHKRMRSHQIKMDRYTRKKRKRFKPICGIISC